jgi:putative hydrolase of HD superfamily
MKWYKDRQLTMPQQRKNTLSRDVELLFEVGCFRHLDRSWKRFLNPDVANNAEHAFRVMWIALLLATHEQKGNHEKLLKMALLHDIAESRTGDVDYLSRQYTKRAEREALEDILQDTSLNSDLAKIAEEYEKRVSIESKLVKDADNLDVELELIEMKARGHSLSTAWGNERRERVYQKLYTASAKRMWREIHASNPHAWHTKAPRNRFNQGDWKKK